ncbi:hypothetical protein BT96DRAFT_115262 [Gymnopus androsaceus JB14]|uniref:DUF6534 domain-containing protein n=1 Tax=Gymnopus androsaceus JB14 TaxID=1447944 RepID=A0A6A4HGM2_9AGAR|nr:hypothetical protein BT96DRAFT_115262 [Gymnopus androsaceus JB14]
MENEEAAVLSLFGPIFIGAFLSAILYGALAVQAYFYYQNSTKDAAWIKYLVGFLLLAETVDLVLEVAVIWESLVLNYGSPTIFQELPTMQIPWLQFVHFDTSFFAVKTHVDLQSVISGVVQIFQGWRIRELTKSNSIFALIALIASGSLAAGTTTTVLVALHPSFVQLQLFKFAFLAWLVASAAGDIVITISLSWFVLLNKTPEFISTNSVLNRIMFLTIQTGLITSVAAVADVLTFTISKDKTLEFIWAYSLSKLYTNSLLAMLNARVEWNKLLHPPSDETDVHFVDIEFRHSQTKDLEMESSGVGYAESGNVVYPPFCRRDQFDQSELPVH